MDWQQAASLLMVGVAALLLAWGRIRRRRFSFARDTHCGCTGAGNSSPQGSIVFRARKGERGEILMKMK